MAVRGYAQQAVFTFEGTTEDVSGRGNDPEAATGITYVAGFEGAQAASFDGSTSFITLAGERSAPGYLGREVNRRTVALSFRPAVDGGGGRGQILYEEGGGTHGAVIYLDPAGDLRVIVAQVGFKLDVKFGYRPTPGEWHHVAVVIDGNDARAYVNGTPASRIRLRRGGIGERSSGAALGRGITSSAAPTSDIPVPSQAYFAGELDDVRIYEAALSPSAIATLAGDHLAPFDCGADGRLVEFASRAGRMARISFATSPATLLPIAEFGTEFNAAGFHPGRGLYYGTLREAFGNPVAFVDARGRLVTTNAEGPDFDAGVVGGGDAYVRYREAGQLRLFDTETFDKTSRRFTPVGSPDLESVNDLAYDAVRDRYYAVTGASRGLLVFDGAAGTVAEYALGGGVLAASDGDYGAAYLDGAGRLFVSANNTGRLYRLTLDHADYANSRVEIVARTTVASYLDGANCPEYVIRLPIDDPDDDDDGVTDFAEYGGAVDATDYAHLVATYGWPDATTDPAGDHDLDGIANYADPDFASAYGLPRNRRGVVAFLDADGDGWVNAVDLDADNDGTPDLVEAGGIDADGDGLVDDPTDADGDGVRDAYDAYDGGAGAAEVTTGHVLALADSDADGVRDVVDLDADGDGVTDLVETGGVDADGNGVVDAFDPPSGHFSVADGTRDLSEDNGFAAAYDPADGGIPLVATTPTGTAGAPDGYLGGDVDGDDVRDAVDIDSDADGIVDLVEAQATNRFVPPRGTDGDGDGVDDAFDTLTGPGAAGVAPVDTDADGVPDYRDPDADGDCAPDAVEGHDTDRDGVGDAGSPNDGGVALGVDSDGDGLDDGYDVDDLVRDPSNGGLTAGDHPDTDSSNAEPDWRADASAPDATGVAVANASCGLDDGSVRGLATRRPAGAATYVWTDSAGAVVGTALDLEGVAPGRYTLTASYLTCVGTAGPYDVGEAAPPSVDAAGVAVAAAGCGLDDGSVRGLAVGGGGGGGGVAYAWTDAAGAVVATSLDLEGVGPGRYAFAATAGGCVAVAGPYDVEELSGCNVECTLNVEGGQARSASCGLDDGQVTGVAVTGGRDATVLSYLWEDEYGSVIGTASELTAVATGTYTLAVEDLTGACLPDYRSFAVGEVECPEEELFIATGISPNGDGINDTWVVQGLDAYPGHEVSVFNRWGTMILSSRDYRGDWDGKWGPLLLPEGTYFYVITLNDPAGRVMSGSVYVFR